MKTATVKENLNQRGPAVDAEILGYLKTCADRNQGGWASPPLVDIARMARTSPLVVQESLCHFIGTGRVVEEVRIVDGVEEEGWTLPKGTEWKHQPRTAVAGFGGGDKAFLRGCGVAAED